MATTPRRLRLAKSLCRERRPQPPTSTPQPSGAVQPSYGACDPSAMSRPFEDNGDPPLSLVPASQPATSSLVPDDYSVNTASPQRPLIACAQSTFQQLRRLQPSNLFLSLYRPHRLLTRRADSATATTMLPRHPPPRSGPGRAPTALPSRAANGFSQSMPAAAYARCDTT